MTALKLGKMLHTKKKNWTGNDGGRRKEVMKPRKALQTPRSVPVSTAENIGGRKRYTSSGTHASMGVCVENK